MHDNPMVQKRLDDIEDERIRNILRTDPHRLYGRDYLELGFAAMLCGVLIGLGVMIGWVVWG